MKRNESNIYGIQGSLDSAIFTPLKLHSTGFTGAILINTSGNSILTSINDFLVPALNNIVPTSAFNMQFNGTQYERQRGNTQETFLASVARTVNTNSADFTNHNARGLHVIINVSAIVTAPSIIATIQGKDPVSGLYYDILQGLPITTVGINVIKIYPGTAAVVNTSANDILPRTYRISVAHANANSITYSVAGALVI